MRVKHRDYANLAGTVVRGERYNAFNIKFVKVRWDSGFSEWLPEADLQYV